MKILLRYTIKTLQENKKRTRLTLAGIVISIAMVTAVSCIVFSLTQFLVNRQISEYGNWEIAYENCTNLQQQQLLNNSAVKSIYQVVEGGYAKEPKSQNEEKPYLYLRYFSPLAFENLPIKLTEGRLPENSNEVVISSHLTALGATGYKVGDTINRDFGQRVQSDGKTNLNHTMYQQEERLSQTQTKTLTITGVIERVSLEERSDPGYTIVSLLDDAINQSVSSVYVSLHHVVNDPTTLFPQLQPQLYPGNSINEPVIEARQNIWETDYFSLIGGSAILTLLVILAGSVSLIYNAFSISLAQRCRQFGLLASLGATARQRRQCVWMEAFILMLIALPIGVFSGYCGIAITLRQISPAFQLLFYDAPLVAVLNSSVIVTACLFSAFIILLSTFRPAKLAAQFSPMQAIRMEHEFVCRKKEMATKWIRKIGNVEAEFAYKNFCRNGRKTRVTIFSLAISLVLFTTVASFVNLLMKTISATRDNYNYDILVYDYGNFDESVNRILDCKLEDDYQIVRQMVGKIALDDSILTTQSLHTLLDLEEVSIYALDEPTFLQVLKEAKVSEQDMNQAQPYPILALNQFEGKIDQEYKEFEIYKTIPQNWEISFAQQEKLTPLQFKTVGVVNDFHLFDRKTQVQNGTLSFLVSQSTMDQLTKVSSHKRAGLYLKTSQSEKLIHEIEQLKAQGTSPDLMAYDVGKEERESRMVVEMMSVMSYGFITLISLICITNVANTLVTNVTLRRKEFAMLKSVGMTPKSFMKMIRLESIYYGFSSILIAIPFSYLLYYLMFNTLQISFICDFTLITQLVCGGSVVLLVITFLLMEYAVRSTKMQSIVSVLKEDQY